MAARGLDVPAVSHVINFSLGGSLDTYVHRVGRCGRAGRPGTAHTFVVEGDEALAAPLVALLQHNRQPVPRELAELVRSTQLAEAAARAAAAKRATDDGEDDEDDELLEQRKANRDKQLAMFKARQAKEKKQQNRAYKRH